MSWWKGKLINDIYIQLNENLKKKSENEKIKIKWMNILLDRKVSYFNIKFGCLSREHSLRIFKS